MAVGIRVSGKMGQHVARDNFGMLMEIDTRVNGKMIKPTVMVFISMRMVLHIRAIGKMMYNMDKAGRHGSMVVLLTVNIVKGSNTGRELISGQMVVRIREDGLITK